MDLLNKYFEIQGEIFKYFGYEENWRVIPLSDDTSYYWTEFRSSVRFCKAHNYEDAAKILSDELGGQYYENEIYTQRFLNKYVYRKSDYTLICVDTHTDGNKFLSVFDNSKEVKINEQ